MYNSSPSSLFRPNGNWPKQCTIDDMVKDLVNHQNEPRNTHPQDRYSTKSLPQIPTHNSNCINSCINIVPPCLTHFTRFSGSGFLLLLLLLLLLLFLFHWRCCQSWGSLDKVNDHLKKLRVVKQAYHSQCFFGFVLFLFLFCLFGFFCNHWVKILNNWQSKCDFILEHDDYDKIHS